MSPIGPMPALAPAMLYGLGALAALSGRGWSSAVAHLFAVGGGLAGVAVAVSVLLGGTTLEARLYAAAPFAGFSIRLDPLAAFFLLLISLLAVAASLYAVGYLAGERVGPLAAAYNGFLAAMSLVTLADSVFAFLFAWEAMSLLSYFLVMRNHYDAETRRAGFIYLVMTHIGTAFLAVAFFTLSSGAGSLEFAAFRSAAPHLPPLLRDLIFLSALVGFGAKAGLIPLHVWLPRAHPAAPSHVSALMSGAMIKTAVYGLLRVSWEFAGPGPAWWGELLLALGAVSAVMGVLYALMERDLKRLLAFSSIENMGIIQLGLGAALLLMARGQAAPAALALTAALFHSLNHAAFKGLLFLAAGAVQHRAHTRDLDRLGGLVRRMPWTAGAFLLGAAAIAALPPLNGFASEWLTFQSLLALGATAAGPLEALSAALAAGALALTGGVAALTFVKAFGVGFLGVARSDNAARATEAAGAMRGGMLLLALLCLVLGLAPTAALRLTLPVTTALTGSMVTPSLGLAMLPHPQSGAYAPAGLLALLAALGVLGLLLGRALGGGPERTRIAPPWACGVTLTPAMQFNATALAQPMSRILAHLLRPIRKTTLSYALKPYFINGVRHEFALRPVFERWLYRPATGALLEAARWARRFQSGGLRVYLGYMLATLVAVLLLTR